jgi:hypothetical protein
MQKRNRKALHLLASVSFAAITTCAFAQDFDVPQGDLKAALDSYRSQSGVALVVISDAVKGIATQGVKGNLSPDAALTRILRGTGFVARRDSSGMIAVIRDEHSSVTNDVQPL